MSLILAAALIAGLPQSDVVLICTTVRHRQEYRHERDAWDKAWAALSFNGVDLRDEDRREIEAFCAGRGR